MFEESGGRAVLDIPCGVGAFAKRLLDRGLSVTIKAVRVSVEREVCYLWPACATLLRSEGEPGLSQSVSART